MSIDYSSQEQAMHSKNKKRNEVVKPKHPQTTPRIAKNPRKNEFLHKPLLANTVMRKN
jgi:hypothetical protein